MNGHKIQLQLKSVHATFLKLASAWNSDAAYRILYMFFVLHEIVEKFTEIWLSRVSVLWRKGREVSYINLILAEFFFSYVLDFCELLTFKEYSRECLLLPIH